MILERAGIKIAANVPIIITAMIPKFKTVLANFSASSFPFLCQMSVKIGIKAACKAPATKIFKKKIGDYESRIVSVQLRSRAKSMRKQTIAHQAQTIT